MRLTIVPAVCVTVLVAVSSYLSFKARTLEGELAHERYERKLCVAARDACGRELAKKQE